MEKILVNIRVACPQFPKRLQHRAKEGSIWVNRKGFWCFLHSDRRLLKQGSFSTRAKLSHHLSEHKCCLEFGEKWKSVGGSSSADKDAMEDRGPEALKWELWNSECGQQQSNSILTGILREETEAVAYYGRNTENPLMDLTVAFCSAIFFNLIPV